MKKFDIELNCDSESWWRFNVYFNIVCLDENDCIIGHCNKMDEPYKINTNALTPPLDYSLPRKTTISTPECKKITLYLYIISNSLPQSNIIGDLATLPAYLSVSVSGKTILQQTLEIDQFGGHTIAGQQISI